MKHTITYILLSIPCFLPSVHAQTTMTLQQCKELAHSKNLMMQNGVLSIERAKAMQKTAFTLEPTEIMFTQDLTDGATPDNSLDISQQFSLPGVYRSRSRSLKAQTIVEELRHDVTTLQLDQEVESVYYNIMYIREKYRILLQQDSAYSKFHVMAKANEKAGETSRLAHINADKLTDESRLTLQNTKSELLQAQYKLAMLMNSDVMVEPAENDLPLIDAIVTDSKADNVYDRLSDAEIKAAEYALKEVKSEALPTLSLEAKYYALIKGLNPYHVDRSAFEGGNGFVFVGVGVNVPLSFGAHAAKVKAAKRDIDIQNNNKLIQQQQLWSIAYEQRNECEKALHTISYYKDKGLKQADELIRIAQVSYEQGEIDYIELMDNIRAASEIRLQYIEAVNQYNQAMIKLKTQRPTPTL